MRQKIPFQVNHTGKCDTCKEEKTLDSMVRKDYTKGNYECIDCKTEKESIKISTQELIFPEIRESRLKRLLVWVFG